MDKKDGCVKPSKGVISAQVEAASAAVTQELGKEPPKMLAKVGKPAPDFDLSAFVDGGFQNVRLGDYKGKWIVVCFYPGDFTFV